MKIVYALFIGIVLFSFAGIAQAQEDPYSGSYSCSGEPQEGCGQCKEIEIYPASGVVVRKNGDAYDICPQFSNDKLGIRAGEECVTVKIVDGVAHWSGTSTSQGETFTGEVTLTFSGNTMNAKETGQVSGECSCSLNLSAICTK